MGSDANTDERDRFSADDLLSLTHDPLEFARQFDRAMKDAAFGALASAARACRAYAKSVPGTLEEEGAWECRRLILELMEP